MNKTPVRIDIVSDVVCPWCIIGYKRLIVALEQLDDSIDAEIHWHPFELNPHMSEGGENLREHLAAKYGTTLKGSIKARENLTQIGAELDFKFDYFDEMKMFNTFKAHQLLHYARKQGKETELKLRLFSAFFGERKAVDQIDVLVKEALAVGLDETESRNVLESESFADEVRREQYEWRAKGIQAVPSFIINQRYAVSGAQEPATLIDVIRQATQ